MPGKHETLKDLIAYSPWFANLYSYDVTEGEYIFSIYFNEKEIIFLKGSSKEFPTINMPGDINNLQRRISCGYELRVNHNYFEIKALRSGILGRMRYLEGKKELVMELKGIWKAMGSPFLDKWTYTEER